MTPTPRAILMDNAGRSFWFVYFEPRRHEPDSGLFAKVYLETGEVEMATE